MRHVFTGAMLLGLALFILLGAADRAVAQESSFVYVNESDPEKSAVSALSVEPSGILIPIPGSPFPTAGSGGGGGLFAAREIAASFVGTTLFAANTGTGDISVFTVDPLTGALTLVPGAPFALPIPHAVTSAISLAPTPDGRYLVVSSGLQLGVFAVAPNGALTPVPGGVAVVTGVVGGFAISPDGRLLAVPMLGVSQVAVFHIDADGTLTQVPGSPFAAAGNVSSATFSCASDRLYVGTASSNLVVNGFAVGPDGALTPLPGSPYTVLAFLNSNVVLLSRDNQTLFVSNQFGNSVTAFHVEEDGSLTLVPGSPFATGGSTPTGMALDSTGGHLYVSNSSSNTVAVFSIGADGSLQTAPGSPFSTGGSSGSATSLALFPPNIPPSSCPTPGEIALACPPDVAAPSSTIEDSDAGAVVTYTAPIATGGCTTPAVTCEPAPGSFFPVGTTTVTCTASDTCGASASCSFTVTVTSPFADGAGVCVVDDASGDTFSEVVDRASPLYGFWTYRVAATGKTISGRANRVSYIPGRSLVSSDSDYSEENPTYFMSANVGFGTGTATVTVQGQGSTTRHVLRDRNLRNNPPCP